MEPLSLATRSTAQVRATSAIAPDVAEHLEVIGLPAVLFGGRFRLDRELQRVRRPDGYSLLRLGDVMLATALCVDPMTGRVVEIWDSGRLRALRIGKLPWRESFVNSTLGKFVETATAVIDRLPYYHGDSSLEERRSVARELGAMIESIDPPAMDSDLFWSTFVDDVEIGDFATEDLD